MNFFYQESDRLMKIREKTKRQLSSYKEPLNIINLEDVSCLQAIFTSNMDTFCDESNIFKKLACRLFDSKLSCLKKILATPSKMEFNWNEVKYHDQNGKIDRVLAFREVEAPKSIAYCHLTINDFMINSSFLNCRFEKFLKKKEIYPDTKLLIKEELLIGKVYSISHLSSCEHKVQLYQMANGHYETQISKSKYDNKVPKCRICYSVQASLILSGMISQIDDPCQLCMDCALMLFDNSFIESNAKYII